MGLHGHFNGPHADTNMVQLNEMLIKEEKGEVAERGLRHGDASSEAEKRCQTFEIYIMETFRMELEETYLASTRTDTGRKQQRGNKKPGYGGAANGPARLPEEYMQRLQQYNKMNALLKKKINGQDNLKIDRKTFWQHKFGSEFGSANVGLSNTFLYDDEYGFTKVLLMGREADFVVFHILCYAVWDLAFSNTCITVVLVWIIDKMMLSLRSERGIKNIALKTLMDERFLI